MDQGNESVKSEYALSSYSGIDYQTLVIFTWIIFTVACQAAQTFGIVTNIINIICFVKQGLNDPVNISLLGLAISDLGCLVTMIWINISFTPAFSAADLPFDVMEVFYLVAAMPHATFSRISSWITAMITLERCLCIIAPLKFCLLDLSFAAVKTIVTPERVTAMIIIIFILLFCCAAPIYVVHKLDFKFSHVRNITIVGLISTPDRESVEKLYFSINNFFLPFAAFIVITTCTAILVVSLQKRTIWRRKSAANYQDDRNQKAARMVVMISAMFIFCFVPIGTVFLAISLEPALAVGGRLVNIGIVAGGIGTLLETINSSANIFIYYNMSTKYRNIFRRIFCKQYATEHQKVRNKII